VWIEAKSRLIGGNTVVMLEQLLFQKESERWKNILTRIISNTPYLAENCGIWGSPISCTHKIMENI
jgi:hypothetical protein